MRSALGRTAKAALLSVALLVIFGWLDPASAQEATTTTEPPTTTTSTVCGTSEAPCVVVLGPESSAWMAEALGLLVFLGSAGLIVGLVRRG